MRRVWFIFGFVVVLSLAASISWAEGSPTNEEMMEELQALKKRVAELESKLSRQDTGLERQALEVKESRKEFIKCVPGEGVTIEPAGLNISAGATFVTQMAIEPNNAAGDDTVTDAGYSADICIEKEFGDWGLAFMHLEAGDGAGLDGDEIMTFGSVNRDAMDTNNEVDITELWYEHNLFDHRLALMGGKLDPTVMLDYNEIANCECTRFLSAIFRNSSAIEFPDDNTYGFRALVKPFGWMDVEGGIFDDNADWEDIFSDIFSYGQVNFKPNLLGYEGNYRAYFWFDDAKHAKWADPGTTTQVNLGFGTSCDQRVTEYLTLFGRFGWQDPDVSIIEWAWSTGLQLDGAPWGREKDYLGCAVGMDIPGDDYGDAGNLDDPEGHIEVYYNIYITDYLRISPDAQFIWSPNGDDGQDPITILGARGQLDF